MRSLFDSKFAIIDGVNSGYVLRQSRQKAGMTQRELARRAGVTQSVVGKIETGRTTPRVDTFDRLLRAAGHRLIATPAAGEVDPHDWGLVLENMGLSPRQRAEKAAAAGRFAIKLRDAGRRARAV